MVPFQSLSFFSYPIVLRVCWVPDLILAIVLLSKPSGAPQNLHQPWHADPVVVKFTQLNLGMLYTYKITSSGIFTVVLSVTYSNQLSSVSRKTIWKPSLASNNANLLLRCMFSGFLQAKFTTDWLSHHALTILPANYDPVLLMQQQLAHSS